MQTYGPRQGSRTLPWAECQIFLEALFIPKQTQTPLTKGEKIFYLVFIANLWPKAGVEDPNLGQI